MLDTIPGVALVRTETWNREAVINCFFAFNNTSGIAVFFKTLRYVLPRGGIRRGGKMGIQGSWCYTRESGAASILSGEPSVPGKIPGGVAHGSIPGVAASTQGGVPTVPGKIPGGMESRPTPAGQQSGVVSSISSSMPDQVVVFVYSRG